MATVPSASPSRRVTVQAVRASLPPLRLAALGGLVVLAAGLRFWTLDAPSVWFDEAVTLALARMDFLAMLDQIPGSESTPPLYYVLAWGWGRAVGTSEAAVRALSSLIGVATVPFAYAAAARLATPRIGLALAAIVAVSPLLVWHSQDARAYSLLVLLCALSLLLFARALDDARVRALWAWAGVAALAVLAHYFAIFLVAGEALLLVLGHPRRRAALASAGAVALVGAALLPLALAQRAHEGAAWLATRGLGGRIDALWPHFAAGYGAAPAQVSSFESAAPPGLVLWATLLSGAALALALVVGAIAAKAHERTRSGGAGDGPAEPTAGADARERRALAIAAALTVAVVGAPLLLALLGVDYVLTRNLLPGWLVLALLAAIGIGARRTRWVGVPVGLALVGVLLALTASAASAPRFGPDRWGRVARALGDPAGQRIVQVPWSIAMPLALERPGLATLPAAGARVEEIVVLRRGDVLRRRAPAEGFELVDRTVVSESFTVLRYRSRRPTRITPQTILGDSPLRRRRTAVLIAPPLADSRAAPPTLSFCPRAGSELRRVAIRTPCAVAYPPGG